MGYDEYFCRVMFMNNMQCYACNYFLHEWPNISSESYLEITPNNRFTMRITIL